MSEKIICGKCGEPLTGVAQDQPCPKCGSTSRAHGAAISMSISSSMSADATLVTYPQRLLALAQKLIDDGELGIAIVVAHMACEVAVERTMSEAYVTKHISYLEDAVSEFHSGYNLANNRLRKLYTALTGDEVEKASFWGKFKASAVRRNNIVHSSGSATKAEAEESHSAARALVTHLNK